MATSRINSLQALRTLGKGGASVSARRGLHITGSNSAPQAYNPLPSHIYDPLTLSDLREECQRRGILHTGTKHDLVDRLVRHDGIQRRALNIAMRRFGAEQGRRGLSGQSPAERPVIRQFNTSRALKAVEDSSTIDFAYLPKLFDGSLDPPPAPIRVPILPDIDSAEAQSSLSQSPGLEAAAGNYQEMDNNEVTKAQIVTAQETMADGGAHVDLGLNAQASPMTEVVDNDAVELGIERLTELTETVSRSARKIVNQAEESAVRKVWNGFLDDLFGKQDKSGPRMTRG